MTGTRAHEKPSYCPFSPCFIPASSYRPTLHPDRYEASISDWFTLFISGLLLLLRSTRSPSSPPSIASTIIVSSPPPSLQSLLNPVVSSVTPEISRSSAASVFQDSNPPSRLSLCQNQRRIAAVLNPDLRLPPCSTTAKFLCFEFPFVFSTAPDPIASSRELRSLPQAAQKPSPFISICSNHDAGACHAVQSHAGEPECRRR